MVGKLFRSIPNPSIASMPRSSATMNSTFGCGACAIDLPKQGKKDKTESVYKVDLVICQKG